MRHTLRVASIGTLLGLVVTSAWAGQSFEVSRDSIGAEWPFKTITSGTVECDGRAAVFKSGEAKYSLNGAAKDRYGHPFPYEKGILRQIPYPPPLEGETYNADTEVLRRLCD